MRKFLDKYDTLIFDMDGVITSESAYWDAAALTVREFLEDERYLGNGDIDALYMHENVQDIRDEIFLGDKLITYFKGIGVNSNWDLGYITVLVSVIIGTTDSQKIYEYAETITDNALDAYDKLARMASEKLGTTFEYCQRNGKLWTDMRDCFQEWYLGDDMFFESYKRAPYLTGKPGLYRREKPLIELDTLKCMLEELGETKRLCVGTGRLYLEIVPLLEMWGVADYFDRNGICNYNHVITVDSQFDGQFTKPHPYIFLKALYGLDYPDSKIVSGDYDVSKIKRTLVVGDAGADILAAKAMGADFCAVLTGVAGEAGRSYFEEQNAEYILNNVGEMKDGN